MSSQKTENLNLHRWEGEDKFLRTEMNENFSALDSAVAENAAKAAADLAAARGEITGEISAASATLDGKITTTAATAQNNLAAVQNQLAASINAVSAVANGKIALVTGICTGNGAETQTISLGFTPKAVILVSNTGKMSTGYECAGGVALPGSPVTHDKWTALEVTEGGFILHAHRQSSYSYYVSINNANSVSYFLAFV